MTDFDAVFPRALLGVAAELQLDLLEARDPAKVYESDLRRAVRRHVDRELPPSWTAQVEVAIGKNHVRGAGTTDVVVLRENVPAIAIELKWWADAVNRIDDALWDAVKLATFVREGVIEAGYLIAAGRVSTWRGANPLLSLWEGFDAPLAEMQCRKPYYQTRFDDVRGPRVMPSHLRTEPIGVAVSIHTVDEDWLVRCCRVWPNPRLPT
jgi:hypothetical protein